LYRETIDSAKARAAAELSAKSNVSSLPYRVPEIEKATVATPDALDASRNAGTSSSIRLAPDTIPAARLLDCPCV
jgi:hypothetical protein